MSTWDSTLPQIGGLYHLKVNRPAGMLKYAAYTGDEPQFDPLSYFNIGLTENSRITAQTRYKGVPCLMHFVLEGVYRFHFVDKTKTHLFRIIEGEDGFFGVFVNPQTFKDEYEFKLKPA